jgi:hypothetical protein
MTTDNCFYLQNILIQTSQTGGQQYSDTPPFSSLVFPAPPMQYANNQVWEPKKAEATDFDSSGVCAEAVCLFFCLFSNDLHDLAI